MKAITVIPARLASTRLPRKLLLPLNGKPVLQHTYENACKSLKATQTFIATDSEEIRDVAQAFGADVILTSQSHTSGSARVAEAIADIEADIVVNVQGDEPELSPAYIDGLIETQEQSQAFASTLACPFPDDVKRDDPNFVKVVFAGKIDTEHDLHWAAYFSRAAIPFSNTSNAFLHIGAYAFSRKSILAFAGTDPSDLEKAENLEQLRIISMGERIAVKVVAKSSPGIDTQADLDAANQRLAGSA